MALKETLLNVFYPNRCCLCDRVIASGRRYCRACLEKAPYVLPPVCERCGRGEERCICRGHRRSFERCVSPFYYEAQAETGILRLKKYGFLPQVRGFAAEMAEVLRREYGGVGFHVITAVPLYPTDYRRRGFNQSELLAQELASLLDVPYRPLLHKVYATRPQKDLTARQRSGNLLGAFDAIDPALLPGRTVLLVDDVITTGSTLDECAKMLKIYGADSVYAVTAAASVLKNDGE